MNPRKLLLALTGAALALACVMPLAAGADDKAKPATGGLDEKAMMNQWMKMSAPSEGHKIFDKYVGNWNATVHMWMDPSQPPSEEKGMATYSKMLGGRFLVQNFKGTMMGMPFEGTGWSGYDNFRQQYVDTWVDNFNTGIMRLTGNSKDASTIEMTGTMDEPMTGEKDKKVRSVTHWTGDDSFSFSMYDNIPGKGEYKSMEILYTRAK